MLPHSPFDFEGLFPCLSSFWNGQTYGLTDISPHQALLEPLCAWSLPCSPSENRPTIGIGSEEHAKSVLMDKPTISTLGMVAKKLCFLQTPSKNEQNQKTKKPKTCQEQ